MRRTDKMGDELNENLRKDGLKLGKAALLARIFFLPAAAGLLCGWGCMVVVMLFWNYLITPIYMGYPREAVVGLLIPAFLPFNLIKGGLNVAMTMILYKPVITALRHAHLMETNQIKSKTKLNVGLILTALLIITTCILLILSIKHVF